MAPSWALRLAGSAPAVCFGWPGASFPVRLHFAASPPGRPGLAPNRDPHLFHPTTRAMQHWPKGWARFGSADVRPPDEPGLRFGPALREWSSVSIAYRQVPFHSLDQDVAT